MSTLVVLTYDTPDGAADARATIDGLEKSGAIQISDSAVVVREADGTFVLHLGGEPRTGNWLPLAAEARFVQVRQVFADWERERPAEIRIERLGGPVLRPRIDTEAITERIELLQSWLERGGALRRDMSRVMLAQPPNTLVIPPLDRSNAHAGLRGQAYGMGNFTCGPGEAVIFECTPPRCRHSSREGI